LDSTGILIAAISLIPLLFLATLPSKLAKYRICLLSEFCYSFGPLTYLKLHSFKVHYYHHCPILDTSISVAELYQYSPILFWTIIMISSRWHRSMSRLHKLLLESYRSILSGTFIEPFHHSLESIQAIILICIWPLAVPRQVDDPTWNYCGLVTNAAVRMGINRLDLRREGSHLDKGISIKNKTWMAW
jgi:hypothetical protein